MQNPNIQVIETDGQDTMPTMAKKINDNFQALVEYVTKTFENASAEKVVASKGQTTVSTGSKFSRNSKTLIVFLNGVVQIQNEAYVETSDSSIKFLFPLEEGDEVYMLYNRYVRPQTLDNYYTKEEIDAMFEEVRK